MALNQATKANQISWQRTLFIMFFAQMITAVGFSSIFPFLPLYVEALGSSSNLSIELLAGMVYSGQSIAMMIASPIWGMIADRFGRKLMVERSLFGGAAILLLMAFVQTAEQLVLLRIIQGFITGTVAAANALIASIAPRDRTGYAMGMLQVGLGAGVAFGPIIGGAIADEFGYSGAFFVTSALLLVAGLIVLFLVQEDFKPATQNGTTSRGVLSEWRNILSAPGVKATYSMRFMSQLGRMMIVPIAPLFIQTLLVDKAYLNTFTGLVIGVASATTTVSAVFLGKLGDRIGYRFITILSSFIATILYLLQSSATSGLQLLLYQALVGVTLGGIIPAISALLAKLTKAGEEGAVYGLDNSIMSGGRAVAPLLGAAVAAAFGLRSAFTATGILFLLTAMLAVVSLPKKHVYS